MYNYDWGVQNISIQTTEEPEFREVHISLDVTPARHEET